MDAIYQNAAFYGREDGSYSLWDHPHFFAEQNKPEYYKPLFNLGKVLEDYYAWPEERRELYLTVLFIVAQSICCTEEHIRRYFEIKGDTRSQTGKAMTYLRDKGYLERYQVGIENIELDEEDDERYQFIPSPAPYHIGFAGTLLLKYLYPRMALMSADAWVSSTRNAMIQRYVSMNELRCSFTESKLARKWSWHPSYRVTQDRMKLKKPFAVMEIGTQDSKEDSRAWLIFDRAQASQNFVGYIKDRLSRYETLYTTYGTIPIMNTPEDGEKIVVISCATVAIANELQEVLGLQRYSFRVWVLIDEWFEQNERSEMMIDAIAAPTLNDDGNSYSLTRLRISL